MITDLLRLGLRLTIVVALFALAIIPLFNLNEQHARMNKPQAQELALPKSSPQTYTVAQDALPPKPSFDPIVAVSPPPKKVIITPTPTPSVIKKTAAPVRKPVSKAPKPRIYSSSPSGAKSFAASRVSAAQFGCLLLLWTRESGWNVHAFNAGSGAYGIPQALPGTKMATFGADWRNNYVTQIRWGLNYISGRYGSPCSAWAHSNLFGWY